MLVQVDQFLKYIRQVVKNMKKILSKRGNTIIEALIAVVIVSVVLTAVAYGMTFSISNSSEAEYRQIATRYAQDVMEVFRKDKLTTPWATFAAVPANGIRCVPSTFVANTNITGGTITLANIGSCQVLNSTNPPMMFYRAVEKTSTANSVTIISHVYWNVGISGKERSVTIEQTFYRAE